MGGGRGGALGGSGEVGGDGGDGGGAQPGAKTPTPAHVWGHSVAIGSVRPTPEGGWNGKPLTIPKLTSLLTGAAQKLVGVLPSIRSDASSALPLSQLLETPIADVNGQNDQSSGMSMHAGLCGGGGGCGGGCGGDGGSGGDPGGDGISGAEGGAGGDAGG